MNIRQIITLLLLGFFSHYGMAEEGLDFLQIKEINGEQVYSLKLKIIILMTMLSFIPAFIIMCTCFARIIIVFAILRQALGLQQSPPNQVLVGIALILTLLIMRPVGEKIYQDAYIPYEKEEVTLVQALSLAEKPLRQFMLSQTDKKTLEHIYKIAKEPVAMSNEDIPFLIVLPAYVLSELKIAFQIGFLIFLPFLIVDLVVAAVLMSMGMMMLSPLIISLPFKLLIFTLVDGWTMLVSSLSNSFIIYG